MTPDYPKPPFPAQKQSMPGSTDAMQPRPDHGETSYKGSGKLKGMRAIITGGDSGIGRAVAIAYAREGADVLIAFLSETKEAAEVKKLVEKEGRKAVLVPGDLQDAKHCREVIKKAVDSLGGIDILVNNAAHQATFKNIEDISDEEWEKTFRINIHSMFYLTKAAAVPHMEARECRHQHRIRKLGHAEPNAPGLRDHQGRRFQNFTGELSADARGERHPRQCRGSGVRSGRRSFPRRCRRRRPWKNFEQAGADESGPASPPNSRPPMSCWRTRCRATRPERRSP